MLIEKDSVDYRGIDNLSFVYISDILTAIFYAIATLSHIIKCYNVDGLESTVCSTELAKLISQITI